ncbi:BnaA04g16120D [Brassica napus]|uniref:BnaA04g16120D protein n=1 Tax=Brassica napus TaxID=3708 RepID=A0A078GYH9_BRANA|nr:BnaA04g16120D [Brassica napus]
MTDSSRRWRVTRRRRLLHLGSTSPRGGEISGGTVVFHSGLVFGFRLRIQTVMAGRKKSSGRNAPSGVDTVVHGLNSNHKETISLV